MFPPPPLMVVNVARGVARVPLVVRIPLLFRTGTAHPPLDTARFPHGCDLIETSGKIAETGQPSAIASGFRRDVKSKKNPLFEGSGACSPAYAPSRRLWRWSAYRSLPSHKAFRPAPRSSRPAISRAASASGSSGPRFRWRSRAAPPSPSPASRRRRARPKPCWCVRQIRIDGATVYTSAQLAELYADLIGHKITLQAVYDVAGRITAKYGADGYVLSRAIVPLQELDPNGAVVRIQVLEGYVETVEWPAQLAGYRRFLFRLRGEDHLRAAGQHPHHRALPAAGRRPARPEVQEQPQAASDQGGRRDPGGRGHREAGRHVQPGRQPRHPGARPGSSS